MARIVLEQIVLAVKEACLVVLDSKPLQLAVTAFGTVPTAGYENPQLIPYVCVQPPPDGSYDFTFIATPPSGPAAPVISPVVASYVMNPMPQKCKGVRIHASTNTKEALLDAKAKRVAIN